MAVLKSPPGDIVELECVGEEHRGDWGLAESLGSRGCRRYYAAPCGCVASTYESTPAGYDQRTQYRGLDWEKVCSRHAGQGKTVIVDGKKYLDLRTPGINWPLRADVMLEIVGEKVA